MRLPPIVTSWRLSGYCDLLIIYTTSDLPDMFLVRRFYFHWDPLCCMVYPFLNRQLSSFGLFVRGKSLKFLLDHYIGQQTVV